MDLIQTIPVGNTLGEGVLWDAQSQSLWWTDIQGRELLCCDWHSQRLTRFATPERLCSFGFVKGSDRLIAAFESGFAYFHPASGAIEWLARPLLGITGLRFNDGRVDRQGRFWAGTMAEAKSQAGNANLYCLDGWEQTHRRESGIAISNGICWSPDSSRFYFADSPKGTIFAYDFDSATGAISNRRLFARSAPGASPDGANVDRDGFLWSAQWGAGRVVRYAPDGRIDRELAVPASQATCIAFGGPNLDLLFVTSARDGLPADTLAKEPSAGDVFVYKMDVKGLPDPRFIADEDGG